MDNVFYDKLKEYEAAIRKKEGINIKFPSILNDEEINLETIKKDINAIEANEKIFEELRSNHVKKNDFVSTINLIYDVPFFSERIFSNYIIYKEIFTYERLKNDLNKYLIWEKLALTALNETYNAVLEEEKEKYVEFLNYSIDKLRALDKKISQ